LVHYYPGIHIFTFIFLFPLFYMLFPVHCLNLFLSILVPFVVFSCLLPSFCSPPPTRGGGGRLWSLRSPVGSLCLYLPLSLTDPAKVLTCPTSSCILTHFYSLMMEAVRTSETPISFCRNTRRSYIKVSDEPLVDSSRAYRHQGLCLV
jgi:hypothetical protein